jgi:hypothetical protein
MLMATGCGILPRWLFVHHIDPSHSRMGLAAYLAPPRDNTRTPPPWPARKVIVHAPPNSERNAKTGHAKAASKGLISRPLPILRGGRGSLFHARKDREIPISSWEGECSERYRDSERSIS